MLTEYIGNVNPVESGQVFVVGGKTIDAAARLVRIEIRNAVKVFGLLQNT